MGALERIMQERAKAAIAKRVRVLFNDLQSNVLFKAIENKYIQYEGKEITLYEFFSKDGLATQLIIDELLEKVVEMECLNILKKIDTIKID